MILFARFLSLISVTVICASCGSYRSHLPVSVETLHYSGGMEERYELEGIPRFKPDGDKVYVVIESSPRYDLGPLVWPESLVPHQTLESGRMLRFEIHGYRSSDPRDLSFPAGKIFRVRDGNETLFDQSRFPVHHIQMTRQTETGIDGGDQSDRFYRRQERLFPNDGNAYLLCSSGIREPVWVCPACARQAKREYQRPAYYSH